MGDGEGAWAGGGDEEAEARGARAAAAARARDMHLEALESLHLPACMNVRVEGTLDELREHVY